MLSIDGAMGEGGGQVLRSSLALSLCLDQPFQIINIRKARKRPGLMRQHLAAVHAAAEISGAAVEGAQLDSQAITFAPRQVKAGDYRFAIGTAGSTTLLLQTVLPALLTADGPSRLVLEGGTHNPAAPPFDFLAFAFLPLINRMGPTVMARLERPGFYPAGGGVIQIHIEPAGRLQPLQLLERGEILDTRADAVVANLPEHIAQRELSEVGGALGIDPQRLFVRHEDTARGPGNVVSVTVRSHNVTEVFTAFGERGVAAETVADRAVDEAARYLAAGVPVGEHLADQLILPLALARGGAFVTLRPSLHTRTNMEVVKRFTDVAIATEETAPDVWRIVVE